MVFAAFTVFFIGCAESISIRRPPQLPVYEQPICPDEGYIWVPGYWAYGPNGYFWVPGIWEAARKRGFYGRGILGLGQTATIFGMKGIGRPCGVYGGINYGHGYGGVGYEGGYWNEGRLYYNSAVITSMSRSSTPPTKRLPMKIRSDHGQFIMAGGRDLRKAA